MLHAPIPDRLIHGRLAYYGVHSPGTGTTSRSAVAVKGPKLQARRANFAVAGATALKTSTSPSFYPQAGGDDGAKPPPNNISLSDELGWFDAMKPTLCDSPQGSCQTSRHHHPIVTLHWSSCQFFCACLLHETTMYIADALAL